VKVARRGSIPKLVIIITILGIDPLGSIEGHLQSDRKRGAPSEGGRAEKKASLFLHWKV